MKKKGLNYHGAKDARAKTDGINLDLFFDKNQTLTNGKSKSIRIVAPIVAPSENVVANL